MEVMDPKGPQLQRICENAVTSYERDWDNRSCLKGGTIIFFVCGPAGTTVPLPVGLFQPRRHRFLWHRDHIDLLEPEKTRPKKSVQRPAAVNLTVGLAPQVRHNQ